MAEAKAMAMATAEAAAMAIALATVMAKAMAKTMAMATENTNDSVLKDKIDVAMFLERQSTAMDCGPLQRNLL